MTVMMDDSVDGATEHAVDVEGTAVSAPVFAWAPDAPSMMLTMPWSPEGNIVNRMSAQGWLAPMQPTSLEIEPLEDGQVAVADTAGIAVAVADSTSEALLAWAERAQEHYEDLQAHEPELHPHLHEQLLILRKLLG